MDTVKPENDDERIGVDIVKRAVEYPTRVLADNAGMEGSVVVQEVKRRKGNEGYNVLMGVYEDLVKAVKDLPDLPEWEQKDRLAKEKEVLGFYMSSHPLAEHAKKLQAYCSHTTVEAAALKARSEVMLGGMIASIKHSHTKNPKPGAPSRYAMFDLEDTEGIMRCICWPEQFAQFGDLIHADAICVLRGAIDKRAGSEEANLIVNEFIPLGDLEVRYTRGIRVRVLEETHGLKKLEMLHEILRGYPGECQVELLLCLADGRRISCRCDTFRVANDAEMRGRVESLLGAENLRLITARPSGGNGRTVASGRQFECVPDILAEFGPPPPTVGRKSYSTLKPPEITSIAGVMPRRIIPRRRRKHSGCRRYRTLAGQWPGCHRRSRGQSARGPRCPRRSPSAGGNRLPCTEHCLPRGQPGSAGLAHAATQEWRRGRPRQRGTKTPFPGWHGLHWDCRNRRERRPARGPTRRLRRR